MPFTSPAGSKSLCSSICKGQLKMHGLMAVQVHVHIASTQLRPFRLYMMDLLISHGCSSR